MPDAELLSGSDALTTNPSSWRSIKQPSRISRARTSSYVNVCDQCYRRKLGCSRAKPSCDRCQRSGRQCTYSLHRPAGRPRRSLSDTRRDSRPLSNSNLEDTNTEDTAKDVYFDSHQVTVSPSHRLVSDEQSMSQIPSHTTNDLTTPTTLVGSHSSESIIFVDPSLWSKQSKPNHRSATDGRAPKPLMRDRGIASDLNQDLSHPSTSSSEEDIYRDEQRPGSQSEAVFDTSVSARHTDIPTQPMTSQLDAEIMDFDFGSNDTYAMEHGAFDTASVAASSDDGCYCLSDLVQSFEARADSYHTRAASLEVVRMLNETSDRMIHCRENHSGIWYSMLLALYEDAEGCLGSLQPCGKTSEGETQLPASQVRGDGAADKSNRAKEQPSCHIETSSILTSTIFKAFTALSTVVAALPFKPGANIDKAHQEVVIMYAERLRNKFRGRLVQITAVNL